MSISYDPDTQPFDQALALIERTRFGTEYESLTDVSEAIDMAKRMLLQHKVRNFSATDVIVVAQMIVGQQSKNDAKMADFRTHTEKLEAEYLRTRAAEE